MNTKYHIQETEIICPYCDHELEKEDAPREFWEVVVRECPKCEMKFNLSMEIVFTTHSNCEANKVEHDFRPTHIVGFLLCENCEGTHRERA